MNLRYVLLAAIAASSLVACQRDAELPVAATAEQPAATVESAVAPAPQGGETREEVAAESIPPQQPRMDFAYLCRQSDGAWSDAGQRCDITPALCPKFGTWVDESGCKSEAAQADCVADGQEFVDGQGCLIRAIPAAAMREAVFKKE